MHWDQLEGQWHQVKVHVKSSWTKLTDEDIKSVAGKRDVLVSKLRARYGVLKEEAENQVDAWLAKFVSPTKENRRSTEKDNRWS